MRRSSRAAEAASPTNGSTLRSKLRATCIQPLLTSNNHAFSRSCAVVLHLHAFPSPYQFFQAEAKFRSQLGHAVPGHLWNGDAFSLSCLSGPKFGLAGI